MYPIETKILIADDLKGMRKLVKQQLQQMGYRDITEVENGKDGYQKILENIDTKEPFQLVISDWNMPVMTGIDFLKMVRTTAGLEELPFLLLTAEGEFSQVKEAIRLKVSEYIVKPFTPAILKSKLEIVWKKYNKSPPK